MSADVGAQRAAGVEDRVGVDVAADLARDVAFTRRRERQRNKGRLQLGVVEDGGKRRGEAVVAARRLTGAYARHVVDQQPHRNGLQGLPAVEGVAIVRGEEGEIVAVKIGVELDRRRKAAVDRQHRLFADAGEFKTRRGIAEHQHAALD